MAFGEMALLETRRSADVIADVESTALEVPLAELRRFSAQHPHASERIMRNLAQLLADRLVVADTKISLLTAN
jgi:glutaminase